MSYNPFRQSSGSGHNAATSGQGSSHSPAGSSSGSSNYAPTSVPTPGHPLLLRGKLLVYPSNWQGCPQCQDTGYKKYDPSQPCKQCWQAYGQKYNPLYASAAGLQGAKILQKPLLTHHRASSYGSVSQTYSPSLSSSSFQQQQQQPMYTGGSYQTPQHTGGHPSQQPVRPLRRPSPPQVNRADEAREDNDDVDGEAPPAYADAIASGPGGTLPPQRRDQQGRLQSGGPAGGDGTGRPPGPPNLHHTWSNNSNGIHSPYSPPPLPPPPQQHYPTSPYSPPHAQQHQQGPYYPPHPAHMPLHSPAPPPGALVLRPGDPRIGGQLCYKCGGAGVRGSLFFGDETCHRCGGTGRIL